MITHYLTSYTNLSTRIALQGFPTGMTALASVAGESYAESEGSILISPMAIGRYELTIYGVCDGSVNLLYRSLLEVREALPSPDVTEAGHLLTLTDINALTVQVSPALVTIQQGGSLPAWASCIEGDATGVSLIRVGSNFLLGDHLISYADNALCVGSGVALLKCMADISEGFSAELPTWTEAIKGDKTGISSIAIADGFSMYEPSTAAFPLVYLNGMVEMGSGVQVIRSVAQSTEGFSS